jgi:DNA-binding MarR family transcriptional regulator
MSRTGADLALLLLAGFRSLADAATTELAKSGFEDVRPAHEFAMRAIAAGADNASALGRRLGISKQAAGKTILLLEERGYVSRDATTGVRLKRLRVTPLGEEMLRRGEAIFEELRHQWGQQIGPENLRTLEAQLQTLVGSEALKPEHSMWAGQD